MPTLTVPNLASLLLAAIVAAILLKVCWAIPKQDGRWLRGFPLLSLLGGILFGFLLLVDYSEWKEGYATRGNARRATAILAYCDSLDYQVQSLDGRNCDTVLVDLRMLYGNLSHVLVGFEGAALPLFPARENDCDGGLEALIQRCRLSALRSELNPEFEHNGSVRLYFQDRLFDGD